MMAFDVMLFFRENAWCDCIESPAVM